MPVWVLCSRCSNASFCQGHLAVRGSIRRGHADEDEVEQGIATCSEVPLSISVR